MADTAISLRGASELAQTEEEFPVQRLVAQKTAIQRAMKAVMKEDEHYGVIPGTTQPGREPKPSLFQPGADTLCFLFRLRADYEPVQVTEQDTWLAFTVRCRLYHIESGKEWGSGVGSANSREKKYASQASAKLCPKCGKPAIIKGKDDYGGRWLCFKRKDGCGAKFVDGDRSIEDQSGVATQAGVWDLHNTIWKMACKRAKVAAVLTATAASDCFTQDLEDLEAFGPTAAATVYTPPKAQPAPQPQRREPAPAPRAEPPASEPASVTRSSEPPAWHQANPAKMKALQASIAGLNLGKAEADERGLKGAPRAEYIREVRLLYISRTVGREIASTLDLTEEEAGKVLDAANNGVFPTDERDLDSPGMQ